MRALYAIAVASLVSGCGAQAVPGPPGDADLGDGADGGADAAADGAGDPGETDTSPPPPLCRRWSDWDCEGGSFDVSEGGSCAATCEAGEGRLVGSCDPTGTCFCTCVVAGVETSQGGISMTPGTSSRVQCCNILPDFLNLGCCP